MRSINKLLMIIFVMTLFPLISYSNEVNLIVLKNGESITPIRDIESIDQNIIKLFDGRDILINDIDYAEIIDLKKTKITKKILNSINARVSGGGDATGGG